MKHLFWVGAAIVLSLCVPSLTAAAEEDPYNLTFSRDTLLVYPTAPTFIDWYAVPKTQIPGDPTGVSISGGRMCLTATDTLTWCDDEWVGGGGDMTTVSHSFDTEVFAAGSQALAFDIRVKAWYTTGESPTRFYLSEADLGEGVYVSVGLWNPVGNCLNTLDLTGPTSGEDLVTQTLYFSDFDSALTSVIDATAELWTGDLAWNAPGEGESDTRQVTLEVCLDNFRMVPEPGVAALLVMGGSLLAVRKIRRKAA